MKNLNEIISATYDFLVANVNTYLPEGLTLTSANFSKEFPDFMNLPKNIMVYISPDNESISQATFCQETATFSMNIDIFVKREKASTLTDKLMAVYTAIGKCFKADRTLNQSVDTSQISSAEFFAPDKTFADIGCVSLRVETRRTVF